MRTFLAPAFQFAALCSLLAPSVRAAHSNAARPWPQGPTGTAITELAVGNEHTCALATSGDAYCWGLNASGQLGNGSTRRGEVATPVAAGGLKFTQITVGSSHTCALAADGQAYCWGDNKTGQLGDRSTQNRRGPTAVATVARFERILAFSSWTCGVAADSSAHCWGAMGTGSGRAYQDRLFTSSPTALPGIRVVRLFASMFVRGGPCGISGTGEAFCWQLRDTKIWVIQVSPPNLAFRSVVAPVGLSRLCGLLEGGVLHCWMVSASATGRSVAILIGPDQLADSGVILLTEAPALTAPLTILTGELCGLGTDRTPYCARSVSTPGPIEMAGLTGVPPLVSLSGGYSRYSNTCGLSESGDAYCWSEERVARPLGGPALERVYTRPIGSGGCGLPPAGGVYCWGSNEHGQVGDGTRTERAAPVAVLGLPNR
ncbi:MAG: RCC1 domain-containing protein [Gemmatimonadales bacterium]